MQGAHVTQELPAKAKHVSAKGDEDKGEAAIGLHCIVRYGVPLESKMDNAYSDVMCCPAENHGGVGIEQKTLANTGDADMHQHQKQAACQTSRQVDNANQATQTHVSATAIQQHTLSPSPDGKQSIARYSRMHSALYVNFCTVSEPCAEP